MGFFTAKVARPDVHRAADFLLRMVVSGRLTLCMKPPGYHETRGRDSVGTHMCRVVSKRNLGQDFKLLKTYDCVELRKISEIFSCQ